METLSLLGILGICSWDDLRFRKIRILLVLLSGVIGICFHLYFGRQDIWSILGGVSIGLVLYIISYFSKEKIGKGDAVLVMVTGIYLGFWNNLLLFWGASLMASVVGIFLIFIKKKGRSYELPFIPFMLVMYLFLLGMWGGKLVS